MDTQDMDVTTDNISSESDIQTMDSQTFSDDAPPEGETDAPAAEEAEEPIDAPEVVETEVDEAPAVAAPAKKRKKPAKRSARSARSTRTVRSRSSRARAKKVARTRQHVLKSAQAKGYKTYSLKNGMPKSVKIGTVGRSILEAIQYHGSPSKKDIRKTIGKKMNDATLRFYLGKFQRDKVLTSREA
jgi:hypothetical protein